MMLSPRRLDILVVALDEGLDEGFGLKKQFGIFVAKAFSSHCEWTDRDVDPRGIDFPPSA